MNQNANTSANDTDIVSRIVPTRAIQQAANEYDVSPDALRAALRRDLERNLEMADEIRERRPIVYETDDYEVALASDAVTTETPMAVLNVYRRMDDSDTDYLAGYALVVPTPGDDETDRDLDGFTNVSEMEGDDR